MLAFDRVLKRLGDFRRFQLYQYILLGISSISSGIHTLANVFLVFVPDHICREPGLENLTWNDRLRVSAPRDSLTGKYSSCQVYDLDYTQLNLTALLSTNSSPPTLLTRDCTAWDYRDDVYMESIVTRWNLVCGQSWKRATGQSIYMLGFLFGCVVFGGLADRFGRKAMLMLSLLVLSLSGIAAAFAPEFWSHVWLRFFSGASSAGSLTCSFVLSMEWIGKDKRMVPGIFFQGWFAFGVCMVSLTAYFVRRYVYLQLIIAGIPLLCMLEYWCIAKSARWLLTQGRIGEAVREVKRAARINGDEYPADIMPSEDDEPEKVKLKQTEHSQEEVSGEAAKSQGTVLTLIKTPSLRWISLNIFFNWFVNSFVYYGLSMGVSDLAGSPFVNLFIFGMLEFPGYLICAVTLDRIGRRLPLAGLMITGGLACLLMQAVPNNLAWFRTTLAMIGKLTISGSFAEIYVYSAEIFPTVIRNVGVGAGSMNARIGGLIAPFVAELGRLVWPPLPGIIFGTASLLAGIFAVFLPETLGQSLPETLEDAKKWRRSGLPCGAKKKPKQRSNDCNGVDPSV